MRKGVLLLLVLVSFLSARANNVQLQGTVKVVSATGSLVTMEVDLSWDNSWRDDYNWDAVWLFFKYKSGVDGAWTHAAINATTATVTGGDYTTMSATTGATVQGLFVCPSKARVGNTDSLKVRVQWAASHTEEQFKNNDVFIVAHGIEMVYIPYGTYTIGDGSSAGSFPKQVIESEAIWNGTSANFPKGYQGFYVMKYETSQEQYVEFLNALTLAEQTALIPGVDALSVGNFVFGNNKNAPNFRNSIILSGKMAGKPLFFDNNLNNNKVYGEDSDGGTLAMNYMSIMDACGYASWAGLRPMTEMEYEKACRRPYPQEPEAGEFAWNSASGAVNATGLTLQGSGREIAATGNVNAGGTIGGPIRCGIFARPTTSSQAAAGATYWGVMEMSGNVSELCANITNTTISRTGNGTGTYNAGLFGSGPTGGHTGYGTRGGDFSDTHTTLTTSSRAAVSCFTSVLQRDSTVGFRCAFTYNNTAGAVNAGTIAFSGNASAVCPGEPLTIANLTSANAGDFSITGYAWYINGAIVPGAVETSLTLDNVVGGQTYSIVRKAVCPLGEASTAALTLKVIAPKLLAGTIAGGSRCGVGEVAIKNTTPASIECELPITYSWWVGGKEIAEQQGEALTHTFTATGSIPVIRRASANGITADATITVAVNSPAPVAGSIIANASPINIPVTISNGSLGSVSCGSLTYSWLVNGVAVAGNGSSLTYTFTSLGTFTVIRRTTSAVDGTSADARLSVAVSDCGLFVDPRDSKSYTAALMNDGRCWMTQDLKFGSKCNVADYRTHSSKNIYGVYEPGYYGVCVVGSYGYLYNWQAAMNRSDAYSSGGSPPEGVQGVCPSGWHLPTKEEYQSLYENGGSSTALKFAYIKDTWKGNLTGYANNGGTATQADIYGRYWNSTHNNVTTAYSLNITSVDANPNNYDRRNGNAVRCVQN